MALVPVPRRGSDGAGLEGLEERDMHPPGCREEAGTCWGGGRNAHLSAAQLRKGRGGQGEAILPCGYLYMGVSLSDRWTRIGRQKPCTKPDSLAGRAME